MLIEAAEVYAATTTGCPVLLAALMMTALRARRVRTTSVLRQLANQEWYLVRRTATRPHQGSAVPGPGMQEDNAATTRDAMPSRAVTRQSTA